MSSDRSPDPEAVKLRLQMMLSKGVFPNPDGSFTEVSPNVAKLMLHDIEAADGGPEDGLDYDVEGGPAGP